MKHKYIFLRINIARDLAQHLSFHICFTYMYKVALICLLGAFTFIVLMDEFLMMQCSKLDKNLDGKVAIKI